MNNINDNLSPAWSFHVDHVSRYAFWQNCFSHDECDKIKEIIKDKFSFQKATLYNDTQYVDDIRNSNVIFVQPIKETEWVYRRITDVVMDLNNRFFMFDLFGFTEGLQFTEYKAPTGKYDYHIDKVYNGVIRKLSIVIQLSNSSDYEGGDFEILDSNNSERLSREKGTLLAFPSYTLHHVTPVTEGTRYSLVGWITGKQFK